MRQAAAAGALLVGLPENFAYLGNDRDHRLAIAEPLPSGHGTAAAPARSWARCRIGARDGCLAAPRADSPRRASGGQDPQHRRPARSGRRSSPPSTARLHLFDVDVPGGQSFRESEAIEPGAEPVVAETPWGGLGLSICYDLRFPELYRRWRRAARASWPSPLPSRWRPARITGTSCCGRGPSRTRSSCSPPRSSGAHGPNRRSYGHALIVDPWGVVIAECGDHEGVALAPAGLRIPGPGARGAPRPVAPSA